MAKDIYTLCNQVKHYEWGSPDFIPRLMGAAADDAPWAELWMGSHPGAPSRVNLPDGEISLGELIARDPRGYLGKEITERYGSLPFLFKLLAVEKPLSIQAHPNLAQAREGFERENREGLAPDAPSRNYRDSNHKPEIVCALTPFTGMCGFRAPNEIRQRLTVFSAVPSLREGFAPLIQALEISDPASALRDFLSLLFSLPPNVKEALTEYILSTRIINHRVHGETRRKMKKSKQNSVFSVSSVVKFLDIEWDLMRNLARLYPNDPAIIAPLYLNVFHLEPGEAIFLKAGLLHAYIHGFAVELMANSDNVLRGGLSSKHIDIPELIKVLDFNPEEPQIIKPEPGLSCFTYPASCEEFSLSMIRGTKQGGPAVLDRSAPSICIVTEGEVSVGGTTLKQGESAFIPPVASASGGEESLALRGNFTIYVATCCAASVLPR
jgi:mannose-6-phosphate isomerase